MLKHNNPDAFASLKNLRSSLSAAEHEARTAAEADMAWEQQPRRKQPRRKPVPPDLARMQRVPALRTNAGSGPASASAVPTQAARTRSPRRKGRTSIATSTQQAASRRTPVSLTGALIVPRQPVRLVPLTHQARQRLLPAQRAAIRRIEDGFRKYRTGLTADHVADSLARVVATLPNKPLTRVMLQELLARDLHSYMQIDTSRMVSERIMNATDDGALTDLSPVGVAPRSTTARVTTPSPRSFQPSTPSPRPSQAQPSKRSTAKALSASPADQHTASDLVDVPVVVAEVRPRRGLSDPTIALHVLQNTDLLRDFDTALTTLNGIFRVLHTGNHEQATSVFLHALPNRFALVVPRTSLQKCRSAFRSSATTLDDVQRMPTTHGLVIQERGAELMAWSITPEYGEAASVKITDLQQFLSHGRPPRFTYEVLGPRKSTRGTAMRDLATFAMALRSRESGIFPLSVSQNGRSETRWTPDQLRRMGEKSPHRVRQHLRTLPTTGEKITVQEHARYGARGLHDDRLRLHLL